MNKLILLLISALVLVGCSKSEDEIEHEKFKAAADKAAKPLLWLYDANPFDDVYDAIDSKDYRFMGIYGVTLMTPGVNISCLDRDKDVNPIKGTSDAMIGYEHQKLIAIANAYASSYNNHMEFYLRENHMFKCNS